MDVIDYAWPIVYRALRNDDYFEQLSNNDPQIAAGLRQDFPGITDAEIAQAVNEAALALAIYSKMHIRTREEEHNHIREMSNEFRKGLVNVIHQIETGYDRVMTMYTIAFYVGLGLIGLSVIASLVLKENVSALIFGGLGMADVVTAFVFRPAQELQNSRGNLTQLQAAFFNWANDVRNWTAFLERLDTSVGAGDKPPYADFERVSLRMLSNTAEMMRLVDLYCEMNPVKPDDVKKPPKDEAATKADEAKKITSPQSSSLPTA
jgi:hypothetical protein